MLTRRTTLGLLTTAPAVFLATPSLAKSPETFAVGGMAIHGYDPVAYFLQDDAIKGDGSHRFEWKGAEWRFATAENLELFRADPERWAPQYGGYCAYAMADGNLVEIDPDQFSIRDEKLYLNYSAWVSARWKLRANHYIARADANWPTALG